MNLSKHFELREFLRSQTALRMGMAVTADEGDIQNLTRLCTEVLEPVRAVFNVPIFITSGLRPPWLNRSIGGSPSSAHQWGGAADIEIAGISNYVVCKTLEEKVHDMAFLPTLDQCILEFGDAGWVHLGIVRSGLKPRQQFLTAYNEKGSGLTHYINGIHRK